MNDFDNFSQETKKYEKKIKKNFKNFIKISRRRLKFVVAFHKMFAKHKIGVSISPKHPLNEETSQWGKKKVAIKWNIHLASYGAERQRKCAKKLSPSSSFYVENLNFLQKNFSSVSRSGVVRNWCDFITNA